MPQVIRSILRRANVVSDLANATGKLIINKPTVAIQDDHVISLTDVGKLINLTPTNDSSDVGANIYLPDSVFTEGQIIKIFNSSSTGNIRITPNSGVTLHTPATGLNSAEANTIIGPDVSRNVAPLGIATLVCVSSNTFVIYGPGVNPGAG